jgi:CPA2 family monovalent cation:H+ antiporter-2
MEHRSHSVSSGIAIGPFTPGLVGDTETINQLAELGVIFLMFGVGLHFSLKDLWRVHSIAIPGAVGQIAFATALGFGISRFWGWSVPRASFWGLRSRSPARSSCCAA